MRFINLNLIFLIFFYFFFIFNIFFFINYSYCSNLSKNYDKKIFIAVSSNFTQTLNKIKYFFEDENEIEIIICSASTGKLYSQILNNAPFDIFLSADSSYIKKLERLNIVVKNASFVYSLGRLIVWAPNFNIYSNGYIFLK